MPFMCFVVIFIVRDFRIQRQYRLYRRAALARNAAQPVTRLDGAGPPRRHGALPPLLRGKPCQPGRSVHNME